MPKGKTNVPGEPLRFSVERAGIEFGMSSATLRKRLAQNSAVADSENLYTTRQITDAVFGGFNEEKLATQRQLTRKYSLENQIAEANFLDRAALSRVFATIADAISSRIMSSELSREAKEDILRDLASWPLSLEEVATRQTRLPRRGNGQEDESEDE